MGTDWLSFLFNPSVLSSQQIFGEIYWLLPPLNFKTKYWIWSWERWHFKFLPKNNENLFCRNETQCSVLCTCVQKHFKYNRYQSLRSPCKTCLFTGKEKNSWGFRKMEGLPELCYSHLFWCHILPRLPALLLLTNTRLISWSEKLQPFETKSTNYGAAFKAQ